MTSLRGESGAGEEKGREARPTNEEIRGFSLQRLREEVVLPKSNKNRRSVLDDGDLSPEECVSYMRAIIDRVAVLQVEGGAHSLSPSDQKILQGVKDAIATQIDVMNSSNVSAQLNAHKKELWKDAREAIPTPKAGQSEEASVRGFPSFAGEASVAFDLGTTFSRIAVSRNGHVEIVADGTGNRSIPSCVAFTDSETLVGDAAYSQMSRNAANTIANAQRIIALEPADAFLRSRIQEWPFKVVTTRFHGNFLQVTLNGETKTFSPEEISAMILSNLLHTAESHLGAKVNRAVVTVPAFFNSAQRLATKFACEIAGLTSVHLLPATSAAAIAYALGHQIAGECNIVVFDLGGGQLGVSLLTLDDGIIEVRATSGDMHLGGEDFDGRLVSWCVMEFQRKHKKNPSDDKRAMCRLRAACERAKRSLSSAYETTIEVDSLFEGIDLISQITRTKFEELCMDLFRTTIDTVDRVIRDAKMSKGSINEIILVGGSTRIPKICHLLQEFFSGKELNRSLDREEAVVCGATVQAAIVNRDEQVKPKTLAGQDILLLEATSMPVGIETAGGVMSVIVNRNSTIPYKKSRTFSTATDNQRSALIQVFDGAHRLTALNTFVGKFRLDGIPPAPRGVPKIQVTVDVDVDGLVEIVAEVDGSGVVEKFRPCVAACTSAGVQVPCDLQQSQDSQLIDVEQVKAPGRA